jgi:manganese/zinc/iron transport system substrate-binding protein
MVADAVKNVGGDRVESIALMGPGVDPHLYRATAGDIGRIEGADVVFHVGLELEGRMSEVLEKLKRQGKRVRAVGEAVPKDQLLPLPGHAGKHDPHLWFDVEIWSQTVEAVADELASADPAGKALYTERAAAYRQRLQDLHAQVREETAQVPAESRVLVTAHDAFGYFGRKYGFEVLGIQGTSTATEAAAGRIIELADVIVKRKVRSVFVESSVSPATIDALRKAVRARGWQVGLGGQLFSDAMGAEGTPEGTYEGMVRHNVRTIAEALR